MKIDVHLIEIDPVVREERVASLRRLLLGGARQLAHQAQDGSPEEPALTSGIILRRVIGGDDDTA
ncbi:MAG: hypothetical protein MRJ68_09135 [Nitrospira sp.]|nr:hypothetical protein [Nitrospira sp.]